MSALAATIYRVIAACRQGLIRFWWTLYDFGRVCNPCRFSIVVVAAGGIAVLHVVDRGREIVRVLLERPAPSVRG